MRYGDPGEARKVAKEAHNSSVYRSRREQRSRLIVHLLSLLFTLLWLLFAAPRIGNWFVVGLTILAAIAIFLWTHRQYLFTNYQPPKQPQESYTEEGQQYQDPETYVYEQPQAYYPSEPPQKGYLDGGWQYHDPSQAPETYVHERPQAYYPEQMPPMQH